MEVLSAVALIASGIWAAHKGIKILMTIQNPFSCPCTTTSPEGKYNKSEPCSPDDMQISMPSTPPSLSSPEDHEDILNPVVFY